jgi:ubiquinone biosynthesis protein UbiJ
MQNIPISLAAAGMVIAREIKMSGEAAGRVLCGKGVRLTDSLIGRLRQLGIESVVVEGHPVKMEGEVTLEQMLQELDGRFSRSTNDPLMMKVKEIYRKRLIKSMGEETGG